MTNNEENPSPVFHPVINGLQKMALYTTRSRWYLIGSNNTQTKFRVLKIDRTEPYDLVLTADNVEYTQPEIKDLLQMIGGGNPVPPRTSTTKVSSGVTRTVSAFGIFGFIRFLEGYYIILITKRRKVAVIGHHSIYKVEDTSVIYIPHESVRKAHEDEYKYFKLINNIDLTSNFYFSYTYDLSNSLQYNMSPVNDMKPHVEDFSESFMNSTYSSNITITPSNDESETSTQSGSGKDQQHYGVKRFPSDKFVWNSFLIEPLKNNAHSCWILPITQGFVGQSNISVFGRSFFLTLIARRSAAYAGTRFLKRGANCEGDVANEVETEQIVHDAHVSSLSYGRFTSFVQIRGSIPCYWSQDISKMVPKPPVMIDVWDPYAETAGKHFNKLLRRFGSPIIVLNLVKRREKKRHESLLNEEYTRLIQQLNLTIPPMHRIQHVAVDMARINKDKKENVMSRLAEIAYKSIKKTGLFLSAAPYDVLNLRSNQRYSQLGGASLKANDNDKRPHTSNFKGRFQTGVVRVNCVDCLDRTNTAQFCLGKCALAFQFYLLGVLDKPSIEFDSPCVLMLEEMYEDHGDTLALQYGGSQLVHRIATYRKTAPWSSHGNDIMQSLSRYLSNTFSDQEKQQAINLFLGIFVPYKQNIAIWELASDYLLHHSLCHWPCRKISSSQWWDEEVMDCLPLPCDQVNKKPEYLIPLLPSDPRIDLFHDYHRPFEFSVMSEFFCYHMNHSSSYLQGNEIARVPLDGSPFSVRGRPPKGPEPNPGRFSLGAPSFGISNPATGAKKSLSFPQAHVANPSPSNASSGASSTDTEVSDDELLSMSSFETETEAEGRPQRPSVTFSSLFSPVESTYGNILSPILPQDMESYQRYSHIKSIISPSENHTVDSICLSSEPLQFEVLGSYTDSSYEIQCPVVSDFCLKTYSDYVALKATGPVPPKHEDILKYQMFASVAY